MSIPLTTSLWFILFVSFSGLIESASVKFRVLPAQTGAFICCETYAPTQQLFYCVLNNSPNFRTFSVSGVPSTFAPAASGLGVVEQRVAAVQPSFNTPFPIGLWKLGDVFIGHSAGKIVKITDGTTVTNPWTTLPENEPARQTVFDRTGTVYDGDLIVSFTTSVYKVQSSGTFQLIVKSNSLLNYEGLDIVPTDVARYGPLSGTILIPQNPYPNNPYSFCCDNPTNVAAIDKTGTISFYNTGCYTDQIFFVHEYDNFYGIDYQNGKVLSSAWADLQAQGLDGEIICMCERWGYPGFSGLRRLYWDSVSQTVKNEPIYLTSDSTPTAGLWEHGCFSRGGSADQLPGGFSFCYYSSQLTNKLLGTVKISKTVLQNYGVSGTPTKFSYPATGIPASIASTTTIAFIQDVQNGFYLQIVNGATNGPAFLDLGIEYNGPADSNLLIRIQNNPTDSYVWNNNKEGRFKWTWDSGTTGLVLGPISAIPGLRHFAFAFTIYGSVGINEAAIISNSTIDKITLSNGTTFYMKRRSCSCGNGLAEDPLLKECDYTLPNSTCCTSDCTLLSSSTLCDSPAPNDICSGASYCTGTSATCPPLQLIPACNCTSPYYGFNCTSIRCDILKSCSTCNAYPECGWCCDSGGCVLKDTCKKPFPTSCAACPPCNSGNCQCGVCVCPAGLGGPFCNYTIDCTGKIVPPGDVVLVIDICGVCGGNGTTCIGCDGIPFGLTFDVCGVCGGDGSSCYDPCPATSCEACLALDVCAWCTSDNKCHPKTFAQCDTELVVECTLGLTEDAIIGGAIGIGAIIGIVIGAAVFLIIATIGSKKGYDAWSQHKNNIAGAQANPLYQNGGLSGSNPFHEEMRSK